MSRRRPAWTVPPANLRLARQDLVRVARRAEPVMKSLLNVLYVVGVMSLRERDEVYAMVDRLADEAHVLLRGREKQVEILRKITCR